MLSETLASLVRQTVLPQQIVLALPGEDHVAEIPPEIRDRVQLVFGPKGLAIQRNAGIDATDVRSDLISFIDDDIELAPDYFAHVCQHFSQHEQIAAFDGVEGGHTQDRAKARQILAACHGNEKHRFIESRTLYGCNMNARSGIARRVRFDENLALYGWMEDHDFGFRCGEYGKVGRYTACRCVHLSSPDGRISEARYGYAQIMNPTYLYRKGSYGPLWKVFRKNIFPAMAKNTLKFFDRPRSGARCRRGRFRGNCIAIGHILTGRIDPRNVQNVRE